MKKYFYFIGILLLLLIAASLIISQVLISSKIKKEIRNWCSTHSIESSDFKLGVNILSGNITLEGWTLKQADNAFRIDKATVSFNPLDFLSKKTIQLIHIQKADITLKHFSPFYLPSITSSDDNANNNPAPSTSNFIIDELRIDNVIVRVELPDGNKTPDITLEGLFKNIGADRNTIFSVKATSNASSLKLTGDFNFNDWKKHFVYQLLGKNVSLSIVNILEEGFLPPEVREQLLSLYFKNALQTKLNGKMDIEGSGEIKEETIDSKLKFVVSDLSCDTENERIKSLINKIKSKEGYVEVNYKIYGTLKNPYLTYDISF